MDVLNNKMDEVTDYCAQSELLNYSDATLICSSRSTGSRLCIYTNNMWFTNAVAKDTFCSLDENVMLQGRAYYLPREFTSIAITAVYVLPQAQTISKTAT